MLKKHEMQEKTWSEYCSSQKNDSCINDGRTDRRTETPAGGVGMHLK